MSTQYIQSCNNAITLCVLYIKLNMYYCSAAQFTFSFIFPEVESLSQILHKWTRPMGPIAQGKNVWIRNGKKDSKLCRNAFYTIMRTTLSFAFWFVLTKSKRTRDLIKLSVYVWVVYYCRWWNGAIAQR